MNKNERIAKWQIILAVIVACFVLGYVVAVWIFPRH